KQIVKKPMARPNSAGQMGLGRPNPTVVFRHAMQCELFVQACVVCTIILIWAAMEVQYGLEFAPDFWKIGDQCGGDSGPGVAGGFPLGPWALPGKSHEIGRGSKYRDVRTATWATD